MSGNTKAASSKATGNDAKNGDNAKVNPQKPAVQLEEDDEFEDFPVEGMESSEQWSSWYIC